MYMPYNIVKKGDKYMLRKKDGTFVNKKYKTKQTAINSGINFMRYRKERGYVKNNKILVKK